MNAGKIDSLFSPPRMSYGSIMTKKMIIEISTSTIIDLINKS